MENIICAKCNKNPANKVIEGYEGLYCYPCGAGLHARYQSRKNYQIEKLKKGICKHVLTCKLCKEKFEHQHPKKKFCSDACEQRNRIGKINDNWIADPEYESCKNGIGNNFHKAYAYSNKPAFLKKYDHVRG